MRPLSALICMPLALMLACGDKEPVEPEDDGWGLEGNEEGSTGPDEGELSGTFTFRERDRDEGYDCSVSWRTYGVASSYICEYCDFEIAWQYDMSYVFSEGLSQVEDPDCRGTEAYEYYLEGEYYEREFGEYLAIWGFSADEYLFDYFEEDYGIDLHAEFDGFWLFGYMDDGELELYPFGPATFDAASGSFSWHQNSLYDLYYEAYYGASYYELYGYEYAFSIQATAK